MSIILGLHTVPSIIISAAVSIIYTVLGGLYSVAFTDVIQLSFIFVSLVRNKGGTEGGKREENGGIAEITCQIHA